MYSPSYPLIGFAPIFKPLLRETAPHSQSVKSVREPAIFHGPVPPGLPRDLRSISFKRHSVSFLVYAGVSLIHNNDMQE